MKVWHVSLIGALSVMPWIALAGNGPAGKSGACSHVIGPVGTNGQPIGFTCTDVGGNALLIWNASHLGGRISVTGSFTTVNFSASDFTVDGSFTSKGPIAFIGNGSLDVTGTISGSSILLASLNVTSVDVQGSLLNPVPQQLIGTSNWSVTIQNTGKVIAKTGNAVLAGSSVYNNGSITAPSGTAVLKAGSQLGVNFESATWIQGEESPVETHRVDNTNVIKAQNVILEARRVDSDNTSIYNTGTITATDTVTLVTGQPGLSDPFGNIFPGTFGIDNTVGKIGAKNKVIVSQYSGGTPGSSISAREFVMTNSADKSQLEIDHGGLFYITSTDNAPTSSTSAVLDSTRTGTSKFTTTSNVIIPQLAPSMTHLNATSQVMKPTLVASNGASEQVRGESSQPVTAKPKSRVKAKPVLVRGAFFDSKISATITPNP